MIISTVTMSLCKNWKADKKEKLACEIYELTTASRLPLLYINFTSSVNREDDNLHFFKTFISDIFIKTAAWISFRSVE